MHKKGASEHFKNYLSIEASGGLVESLQHFGCIFFHLLRLLFLSLPAIIVETDSQRVAGQWQYYPWLCLTAITPTN